MTRYLGGDSIMKYVLTATLIIVIQSFVNAENLTNKSKNLNGTRDKQILEISDKIKKFYIFDDIAETLSKKLKSETRKKTFENLTDQKFADKLSAYLVKNGNDRHFNVLYKPDYKVNPITDKKEIQKLYDEINRRYNYGFEKVMRLDGNIGYVQYAGFPDDNESAAKVLAATMNFVANTNSLILDLRDNRGGDKDMTELFLSYFFDKKIQLSESYTRFNNSKTKSYTREKVQGERYLDKPIYILVNKNTISAAESVAYNLQKRNLATVVGETTYGAANPVKAFFIDNKFHLFIPITSGKNAATNTNWEHTGVIPNIKIKSKKALNKAHILALENLIKSKTKIELTEKEAKEKIKNLKQKLEK